MRVEHKKYYYFDEEEKEELTVEEQVEVAEAIGESNE